MDSTSSLAAHLSQVFFVLFLELRLILQIVARRELGLVDVLDQVRRFVSLPVALVSLIY